MNLTNQTMTTSDNEVIASSAAVDEMNSWTPNVREMALELRELVFSTAKDMESIGPVEESLKWNQPAYRPVKPGKGTTLRIAPIDEETLGLFVPCSTTLVDTYRQHYGDEMQFSTNRAVRIALDQELPREQLRHCIALALNYHQSKKPAGAG